MSIVVNDTPMAIASTFATESLANACGNAIKETNAYLFIYSPRNHSKQVRRSNLYQFNRDFLDTAKDFAYKARSNSIHNLKYSSMLKGVPGASLAVKPEAFGEELNLYPFDELWSGMLVIDVLRGVDITGQRTWGNVFDKRHVMTGYFSEEPINPVNHGNGITVNPRASFHVTHKTVISQSPVVGNMGTISELNVEEDKDIINPFFLQQTDKNKPNLMTPDNLLSNISIHTPERYYGEGLTGKTNLFISDNVIEGDLSIVKTSGNSAKTIGTNINSPRHHMGDLLFSTSTTVNQVHDSSGESVFEESNFTKEELFQTILEDNYSLISNPSRGISSIMSSNIVESFFMMNDLITKFPNMKITDCRIPQNASWDVQSQKEATLNNIASSLISSSLPTLMSAQGISQIGFRYCSRVVNPSSFTGAVGSDVEEAHQVFHMATFVPLSNDMMKSKYQKFILYLKETVFPALFDMNGHFDLIVHAAVSGVTLIKLHFLDDGELFNNQNNDGLYESASSLGGIISPTIGSTESFIHNAQELGELITEMSDCVNIY